MGGPASRMSLCIDLTHETRLVTATLFPDPTDCGLVYIPRSALRVFLQLMPLIANVRWQTVPRVFQPEDGRVIRRVHDRHEAIKVL
jgi:hypothetical protein